MVTGTGLLVIQAVLMLLLIILSALCSSAEMSLFSLSRARVLSYAESKSASERTIHFLMTDYQKTLITIILCNMFANSLISMLNDNILASLQLSPVMTSVVSACTGIFILLLFGEITPMTAAYIYSLSWSKVVALPVYYVRKLLTPVISAAELICGKIHDLLGHGRESGLRPEEYVSFIEESCEEGALTADEADLLKEALALRKKPVGAVMRGRAVTGLVSARDPAEKVAAIIRESRQAYLPVTSGNSLDAADQILSVRDFFALSPALRKFWYKELCRGKKTLFLPDGTTLEKALRSMRKAGVVAALAVDEYGSSCGAITVGDIYSELTGRSVELDEITEHAPVLVRENVWIVDGASHIDVLRKLPGAGLEKLLTAEDLSAAGESEESHKEDELPVVSSNTVNGIFCELSGKIPASGDKVELGNTTLTARFMVGNRVRSVLLKIGKSESAGKKTEPEKKGGKE